jgi:hypothetical protein
MLDGWPVQDGGQADLLWHLRLAERLPAPPPEPPLYTPADIAPGERNYLAVHQLTDDQLALYFPGVALLLLSLAAGAFPAVSGFVTPAALHPERLENIVARLSPPLLRRRGYHALHGFAAARNGRAVLLVGQSHSGKTTAGLTLLHAGWSFLSNDVALLQERAEGIYVLPFPGLPGVRPYSFELLPWLRDKPTAYFSEEQSFLCISGWPGQWGEAARVETVCFPQITGERVSRLVRLNASEGAARLLEQNVQKWDSGQAGKQLTFWQKFVQQTAIYSLRLGENVGKTPDLLE